ncbi:hypothetical protein SAMN05878426_10756 [Phaeovulum vinaykumarii]|uniref:Uncharacterized protein n=1 Tax=Phaeovulum vinaykumarii TaxID=407234 RepID=A0A1N7MF92_9RHOB|nr:hypothetical protein SAMN05421795_10756 [Phaeovulum vinaykumarii]SOC11956.1 hypothetical protein SAMN05878426_10756 [Phaeovulum vinaykumarii]
MHLVSGASGVRGPLFPWKPLLPGARSAYSGAGRAAVFAAPCRVNARVSVDDRAGKAAVTQADPVSVCLMSAADREG